MSLLRASLWGRTSTKLAPSGEWREQLLMMRLLPFFIMPFTSHAYPPAITYSPALRFTPLMIASRDGQLQACELLIEMNADIAKKGGPYVVVM